MTTEEKVLNYCRFCKNRGFTLDSSVIICQLTKKLPEFPSTCFNYKEDKDLKIKLLKEDKLIPLAKKGRKKTITLTLLLGFVTVATMIFSYMTFRELTFLNFLKSIMSLIINFSLLYGLYIGNKKIKIFMSVCFIAGALLGLISIFRNVFDYPWFLILLPQVILYGYTFIFINFDKEYDAHVEIQSGI